MPLRAFPIAASASIRGILQLVDHVAVAGQGQARVVPELARYVDNAPTLVQEERCEAVAQVIRPSVLETGCADGAIERPAAP